MPELASPELTDHNLSRQQFLKFSFTAFLTSVYNLFGLSSCSSPKEVLPTPEKQIFRFFGAHEPGKFVIPLTLESDLPASSKIEKSDIPTPPKSLLNARVIVESDLNNEQLTDTTYQATALATIASLTPFYPDINNKADSSLWQKTFWVTEEVISQLNPKNSPDFQIAGCVIDGYVFILAKPAGIDINSDPIFSQFVLSHEYLHLMLGEAAASGEPFKFALGKDPNNPDSYLFINGEGSIIVTNTDGNLIARYGGEILETLITTAATIMSISPKTTEELNLLNQEEQAKIADKINQIYQHEYYQKLFSTYPLIIPAIIGQLTTSPTAQADFASGDVNKWLPYFADTNLPLADQPPVANIFLNLAKALNNETDLSYGERAPLPHVMFTKPFADLTSADIKNIFLLGNMK